MTKKFTKCVKVHGQSTIWMVKGRERIRFKTWEEYVEAGKPSYELVTEEKLGWYKIVDEFTVRKRKTE